VYPDGQSRLLQDGIIRMRWRAGVLGGYDPVPIVKKKVYR
jgi:hypothetical protein